MNGSYLHGAKQHIVLPLGSTTFPGEWIATARPARAAV